MSHFESSGVASVLYHKPSFDNAAPIADNRP